MKAITAAMLKVYKTCGYVQKQKTQGLNYSYAGEAALIEAIRPGLLENGIISHVTDVEMISNKEYTTAKGARMNHIVAKYSFRFIHAESGEYIDVVALGEAADSGDKAAPKAATIALKYALRQTLLIETGDDPDREIPEPPAPAKPVLTKGMIERAKNLVADTVTAVATLGPEEMMDWRAENPKIMSNLSWLKGHAPELLEDLNNLGFEV